MLTLTKFLEIAEEVFPAVDISYNPRLSSEMGYLTILYEDITVTNTQTEETLVLPALLFQFPFRVGESNDTDDFVITVIKHPAGTTHKLTQAQLIKVCAHPHVRRPYEWSTVCLGETRLNEKISEMANGAYVNEDNWYFVCHFMDELAHTESEEGGPYHYIHQVKDVELDLNEEDIPEAPTMIEGGLIAQSFWGQVPRTTITRSRYNGVWGGSYSGLCRFLQNEPRRVQAILDELTRLEILRRSPFSNNQWTLRDMEHSSRAVRFSEAEHLKDFRDDWHRENGREIDFKTYTFYSFASDGRADRQPYIDQQAMEELPEEIPVTSRYVPRDKLRKFRRQRLFFKGQRLVPQVVDLQSQSFSTTNLEYNTFTYEQSLYTAGEIFRDFLNDEENSIELENTRRYAESYFAQTGS